MSKITEFDLFKRYVFIVTASVCRCYENERNNKFVDCITYEDFYDNESELNRNAFNVRMSPDEEGSSNITHFSSKNPMVLLKLDMNLVSISDQMVQLD